MKETRRVNVGERTEALILYRSLEEKDREYAIRWINERLTRRKELMNEMRVRSTNLGTEDLELVLQIMRRMGKG